MEKEKELSRLTIWFRRHRLGRADKSKIALSVIYLLLVFYPLICMFSNISIENVKNVVQSYVFGKAVLNTLLSAVLSTLITIILAFALASWVERTNIKLRNFFAIIFVIPMLIPSISNGMSLIILFGNNGIINRFLGINVHIYGLLGITLGEILYAFPVAFLMISDILRYEDSTPYEAADVLGIPKLRKFSAITFPYLRKPLLSVIFSTFTLIVTDYGVPLIVGGKFMTIPVVMYQEVIGQLDFGKGAVYGSMLLLPAVVAFLIDLFNKDKGNSTFVVKPHTPSDKMTKKVVAYIGCIVISLFALLPVFAFGVLAFVNDYPNDMTITMGNFSSVINSRAGDYLVNSLLIALFVSCLGVLIAFLTAYLSARMKSKVSRFLHLSSIVSAAIPGVVLGLSYVLSFKGSFIYGTLIILIMVNLVHFISSPYLMIYNSLSKINENLEPIAQTMGVGRRYIIKDVLIPQCKGTILEMFSYFFVNCMMTISAVSFLASTSNKPVSLMINQFEAQMQLEYAAVVSLMILFVNLLIKGIAHIIKTKYKLKKTHIKGNKQSNEKKQTTYA